MSTRAPDNRAIRHLTDFNENKSVERVYPKTQKEKLVSVLVFSGGEIETPHPPIFLGFHKENRFKIGKMYEALTAMVFNQLL